MKKNTHKKFTCLMCHGIGENTNKFVISKYQFKEQIKSIIANNVQIQSIENNQSIRTNQNICLNSAFTFDDGNKSDLWAAEQLAKHGFSATFFIVKDFSLNHTELYINVDDIKEIARMGHSIGVHGKTHTWWTKISTQQLVIELTDTKKWIEDITGTLCSACSAPGGKLSKTVVKAIYASGEFGFLRNSMPKINYSNTSFIINSVGIKKSDSIDVFEKKLTGNVNLYLRLLLEKKIKNLIKPFIGR